MKRSPAPILERIRAYQMVRQLINEGVAARPAVLMARLREAGLSVPSRTTLGRWTTNTTSPSTSMTRFEPVPSEELSFFVGAWIGDGWSDECDGGKRMRLKVRSESFAAEFARAASIILSKKKPYRVWTTKDDEGYWYNVKATSLLLHGFINQPLQNLLPLINQFPKGFLRGLFTAEGNPSTSLSKRYGLTVSIDLSNTDRELLKVATSAMASLGFNPSPIRLLLPKGSSTSLGVATKDGWIVKLLRFAEVERFAREIGFADVEKQEKLLDALKLIREFTSKGAAPWWLRLYVKRPRKWMRRK